jgi:hypothetical protein
VDVVPIEEFTRNQKAYYGRIVEAYIRGFNKVICRWCGYFELLSDGITPEDFGFHQDYERWWYCPAHSEEEQSG